MRNFIFIFATLLTLIIPPVNQRVPPKESGPLILAAGKVTKLAPLPIPEVAAVDTLEPVYVAPVVIPVAPVAPVVVPTPVAVPVSDSGCGDNYMANYIYMHESGCRLNAIAPNGACGIGQAWPCAKLPCSLSDYACQNAFFTDYANSRYGGWAGAYQPWLQTQWW